MWHNVAVLQYTTVHVTVLLIKQIQDSDWLTQDCGAIEQLTKYSKIEFHDEKNDQVFWTQF